MKSIPKNGLIYHKFCNFLLGISCLLVSKCSIPFPELDEFGLLLLAQAQINQASCQSNCSDGDGSDSSDGGTNPNNPNFKKYIFVSQGVTNGNIGGITGADSFCATEKNTNFSSLPGVGSDYKALIVDNTNRRACNAANCATNVGNNIDWVMQPNTEYFRIQPTEVSLFTTNGAGIFVFGNLSNPISTNGGDRWWTGLDADWRSAGDRCLNWSSLSALEQGGIGIGNLTNSSAITDTFGEDCNQTYRLLCVRN